MERRWMGRRRLRCAAAFTAMTIAVVLDAAAAPQDNPRPEPSNTKAEVPKVRYESSFRDYRKFEDVPVTSWRQANELAHDLGGWKAFASGKVPDIAPPSRSSHLRAGHKAE